MKAAVLNSYSSQFDVEDIEIDAPRGREVMVQVRASGLCHSDLHLTAAEFEIPLPAVFGHELAGVVAELGPDCREFSPGDHVVAALIQSCGHCAPCTGGQTYRCAHPEETVRPQDGVQRLSRGRAPVFGVFGTAAFAEYALVHENQLVKVPDEIPFPQACVLGCSTITGAGAALNTAAVRAGESVVVLGTGGVGLNVISGARLAGAVQIIAVDLQASKEALARRFGATDFIHAENIDVTEAVRAVSNGGADHVFEVIGLKATSELALKLARQGGGVYMIGVHRPGRPIQIDVTPELIDRQLTVKGVFMGSTNIRRDIPMYARLYLQGRLNLDDLISKQISISEINAAYDELRNGTIARSVITSF